MDEIAVGRRSTDIGEPSRLAPRLAVVALLLAVGPALGAGETTPDRAAEIGRRVYEKDVASARATDLLRGSSLEAVDERLRGWITVRTDPGGWLARFVGETAEGLVALYDVEVGGEESVILHEEPPGLSAEEEGMFRARQTAIGAMPYRCSDEYNTIVLEQEEEWLVYLLAATRVPGEVKVGGHFRVRVSLSGLEAIALEPLSDSCLTMSTRPSEEGVEAVALMVRHVISDEPVETHTYLSLLHGIPFYVMTDSALWKVAPGGAEAVDCDAVNSRECDHWLSVISGEQP